MSDKPTPPTPGRKSAVNPVPPPATPAPKEENPDESLAFLAPPGSEAEIGRLAHYRILKVLGRGGMGTVFLAEDPRLRRLIALKVMLPSIAKKQAARDRFKREAEATAKIEHDHIVTIYQVHEDRAVPYLAMQFLKGMTLEDWLKGGKRLNVPQILRIGKEIAMGLAAAHACQLIHRDIKPSNIWLDASNKGRVKILDFGLTKPTNEESNLTQLGMIVGTPAYMSPEQARGETIDARSDLFSLGCVLYRLCTGRLPFSGQDPMSMLMAIVAQEPPPLQQFNSEAPASLVRLIHQLLAKKPSDRPASARAVVQAIQEIEREWMSNTKTEALPSVAAAAKPPEKALEDDSAIDDLDPQPTIIPGISKKNTKFVWIGAGLAGMVLTVLSLMCCVGVFVLGDYGQVRVVAEDETAQAVLEDTGVAIWDQKRAHLIKGKLAMQLPSGKYEVDLKRLGEKPRVNPVTFNLSRGNLIEIKLRLNPPRPTIDKITLQNARELQEAWAKYLKRTKAETNNIGQKLVLIPAGEFTMGTDRAPLPEKFAKLDTFTETAHKVRITTPFYMGRHEVTVGQFRQFVANASYRTEVEKSQKGGEGLGDEREIVRKLEFNWYNTGFRDRGESYPVCNITWDDAQAFCEWLSKKEKKVYRLPTEAEWEYACRAGSSSAWHFGDQQILNNPRRYMSCRASWEKVINPSHGPLPVGSKEHPNDFGLYDMHGNIQEMCSDHWDPMYYKKSPVDDPKGPPATPGVPYRVIRGGSFLDHAWMCRSANRGYQDATLGHVRLGFRVVCEITLPVEKE